MFTALGIEDYQALASAQFELGRFTVVTGPTGSGKSAVIRALKLAAFNAKGISFIRHGTKVCKVLLTDDLGLGVAIARGKGQDAYVLGVPGKQKKFTKLGGQTPAEVSTSLGLTELNFAGQFDRPYLLDSSAGEVARMLGRLTNVDLVFEAARKGYARKQEIGRKLKATQAEVAQLDTDVEQYADLPAQLAAAERAEEALVRAQAARDRLAQVSTLAQAAMDWYQKAHFVRQAIQAAEPPSLADLDALAARRTRIRELVTAAESASATVRDRTALVAEWAMRETAGHGAIHQALIDAGTCPTCGLEVPRKGVKA